MSFPFCSRNRCLARFLPVPVCLQTRVVVGRSRTGVVGARISWNSVLSSKPQACFMGWLQSLAPTAVETHFIVALSC